MAISVGKMWKTMETWWFPEIGYPQIIYLNGIFHYKPSSYWGTTILGNPHMMNYGGDANSKSTWRERRSRPAKMRIHEQEHVTSNGHGFVRTCQGPTKNMAN